MLWGMCGRPSHCACPHANPWKGSEIQDSALCVSHGLIKWGVARLLLHLCGGGNSHIQYGQQQRAQTHGMGTLNAWDDGQAWCSEQQGGEFST